MDRRAFIGTLTGTLLAAPLAAVAQHDHTYHVGVVLQGGPYVAAIDGLRDGLNDLGLEEGKHVVFHIESAKGDLKAAEAIARRLEAEKVDMIYALATSVTLAVKRATKRVPIFYYGGTDPVALGLVKTFRKPGGRVTGIYGDATDLAGKRLQLLAQMIPNLRRVVTFYNPNNPTTRATIKVAREAARQLNVQLIEHHVASIEALQAGVDALRPGDADAFVYAGDAMVGSQARLVIDRALMKGLPTIFADREDVVSGALSSYGVSYYDIGRLSARNVRRILQGTDPGDLPMERVDRLHLAINLKTAKALGLTMPPSLLAQVDEVIE